METRLIITSMSGHIPSPDTCGMRKKADGGSWGPACVKLLELSGLLWDVQAEKLHLEEFCSSSNCFVEVWRYKLQKNCNMNDSRSEK